MAGIVGTSNMKARVIGINYWQKSENTGKRQLGKPPVRALDSACVRDLET